MAPSVYIAPLSSWLPATAQPCVISGPCSAESREQVLETSQALAGIPQVKVLRAGVWKPRTRPSAFEGAGEKALPWLVEARQQTGLQLAVEVAKPEHIELCLKQGIDILWFGARTVVNPFIVQELSEALKGVDIPVMVKNPLNPDINLWVGAFERLNQSGITKLAAVHRGFSDYKKSIYRNAPLWQIPIELQRLIPNLPVFCDPSHISGNRNLIFEISQKALDLGFSGLMIETHCHPQKALTDAKQQITPEALEQLLARLVVRTSSSVPEFENYLEHLRFEIDHLDLELLHLLAQRMQVVEKIGHYKRDHNIAVLQINRWREMISARMTENQHLEMDKSFLLNLLQLIHNESIRIQREILRDSAPEKE